MDRLLVLVRHGQSEWNLKNLFTGWRDVDLSELGVKEARAGGREAEGEGPHLRRRLYERADPRPEHAANSCSTSLASPASRSIATRR